MTERQDNLLQPMDQTLSVHMPTAIERRGKMRNNFRLSNATAMIMKDSNVDWIRDCVEGDSIHTRYINFDKLSENAKFHDLPSQEIFWDLIALQLTERSIKQAEHMMQYARSFFVQNSFLHQPTIHRLQAIWHDLINETLHNCQAIDRFLNICNRKNIPLATGIINKIIEPILTDSLGVKKGRRAQFAQRRQTLLTKLFPQDLSELAHENE